MRDVVHIIVFMILYFTILLLTIIPKILVSLWRWESLLIIHKNTNADYFECIGELVRSILSPPGE